MNLISDFANRTMEQHSLSKLKLEIQLQAKNGIDFILSAGILWLMIYFLWTLDYTSHSQCILTFMVGAILLPLAFGLSKVLKPTGRLKIIRYNLWGFG
jgi:hypothetical protein